MKLFIVMEGNQNKCFGEQHREDLAHVMLYRVQVDCGSATCVVNFVT